MTDRDGNAHEPALFSTKLNSLTISGYAGWVVSMMATRDEVSEGDIVRDMVKGWILDHEDEVAQRYGLPRDLFLARPKRMVDHSE